MTKLIYRGTEFDTAAKKTNLNTKEAKADLVYRGYKNVETRADIATPGRGIRRPELTYRGVRLK